MYEPQRRPRDIAPAIMVMFRLALVAFLGVVGLRLYQLQVRENSVFTAQANDNRFEIVEQAAPRGVIYDKNQTILTRNRPSFEIALVPEDIPEDNADTPDVPAKSTSMPSSPIFMVATKSIGLS